MSCTSHPEWKIYWKSFRKKSPEAVLGRLLNFTKNKRKKSIKRRFQIILKQICSNKTYIGQWFDNYSKRKINVKNDSESEKYRKLGNEYYIKRDNKESLRYYNKSVIFATYKSKNYGLALANRSAVFFVLKDYEVTFDIISNNLKHMSVF